MIDRVGGGCTDKEKRLWYSIKVPHGFIGVVKYIDEKWLQRRVTRCVIGFKLHCSKRGYNVPIFPCLRVEAKLQAVYISKLSPSYEVIVLPPAAN